LLFKMSLGGVCTLIQDPSMQSIKSGDACKLVNYNLCDIDLEASFIKVRVRGLRGTKVVISPEVAISMVEGKLAVVINKWTIELLYKLRDFNKAIKERDNYTCHYCGEYGDTVDHIVPLSKGGLSTFGNCVCACQNCNKIKGSMDAGSIKTLKRKRVKKRQQYRKRRQGELHVQG
jgi:hypothetical protein